VALKYRDRADAASQPVALVVEDDTGARAALLVDEILGQRQVVIKSLAANYRPVAGVAAATILGDGRVALILDVNAIIAAQRHDASANALQLTTG
jgi:two-component system chemotaxis sensor kinase CheA